ncbi:2-hydroxyacid dehydrogenase [Pseudogemmobacter sp. W21_MBD1_M6]|uniref:2-hydroxyacid dehydrogenase n=1 Tax=Pseudogemmobacter sp. W21_MBD1_M6 TaxID=3240271 RepID=UPI003F9D0B5A
MKIVFHGNNAATFHPGFAGLLSAPHDISILSDTLDRADEVAALTGADVVIGVKLTPDHPALTARLYQVPGAGYDGIDLSLLPPDCALCNCFGHETAIAEYVMAALLSRHVPLAKADAQLRQGDWHYWAGGPDGLRTELGAQSIGIVGYGHIGQAVAARAAAFGMAVHVANRSPVAGGHLAASYGLDALSDMLGRVDIVINTLPLTETTRGLIGIQALAAMQPHAILMNVGRGAVVDEDALYDALAGDRIGGAILDTWYVYPTPAAPHPLPGNKPFHLLPNVTMTPHMSGWTTGTIARRRAAMAENVNRLAAGDDLINQIQ